jgi:hypothetical protein
MLGSVELTRLCQRLGRSAEARTTVESIRSSAPTRRVRSAAGNVSVRYPSRKMGVSIQAESHRNELAGIYEKEHDPQTLEYYDQPPPIKLLYEARDGRRLGVLHTPDYFVIRIDSIGWEEWKTEAELARLSERMPNRYLRGEERRWRCPPGERYAEQFGFFYRVRSSAEIDWVFQRNLLFLEDYLRPDCPAVDESEHGRDGRDGALPHPMRHTDSPSPAVLLDDLPDQQPASGTSRGRPGCPVRSRRRHSRRKAMT